MLADANNLNKPLCYWLFPIWFGEEIFFRKHRSWKFWVKCNDFIWLLHFTTSVDVTYNNVWKDGFVWLSIGVSCFKNNLLYINIVKFTCIIVIGKSTPIRLNLPKYQILPCLFCKFELTVFMGIFCHKKWYNSAGLNDCYFWSFNCNLQPNFIISFYDVSE